MTTFNYLEVNAQCDLFNRVCSIMELYADQLDDMTGRKGHGEYLGGNGATQWHHVDARDSSGHGEDFDDDMPAEERELLQAVVGSHQDSIEANGQYIVRGASRWQSVPVTLDGVQKPIRVRAVYDSVSAERSRDIAHRRMLGLTAGETGKRTKAQRAERNSPEAIAARKAKRLAKLAARRG
jgi:hypothetical protein